MRKLLILYVSVAMVGAFSVLSYANGDDPTGEELFKENCAVCHPGGDNIVNPKFKLHAKDLKEHGITKPSQIVEKMRNPGPGMTKFDKNTISDKDAMNIAKYVMKTFK